jgi:hypothetical protein
VAAAAADVEMPYSLQFLHSIEIVNAHSSPQV